MQIFFIGRIPLKGANTRASRRLGGRRGKKSPRLQAAVYLKCCPLGYQPLFRAGSHETSLKLFLMSLSLKILLQPTSTSDYRIWQNGQFEDCISASEQKSSIKISYNNTLCETCDILITAKKSINDKLIISGRAKNVVRWLQLTKSAWTICWLQWCSEAYNMLITPSSHLNLPPWAGCRLQLEHCGLFQCSTDWVK